ncbi:Hypothetical Protein FCC1311_113612 [Hondaea fermentalgiana]|uniref:Apple domain-containing protein n=1 Tax=Hondaea fermentalgiana TaxID=2315210 RepID=A0A2R5GZ90_9STRA|nr:Hypothetical Protein FCC1311_113612 [Hondaea fermentalgiana]|eukprot:GBG35138.1 Hypothetical Protein FCC1311_113612 [Hondaea fermentalgiana]
MQRCSMSSTAPKEGSYTSPNTTTTRVTGSLYCENDFEEEDLARKIANIYETPGCMVKDIDWNGHDIGSKHAADTPHDCRRLCQENANCVVFVYRGTDKVCWLKTAKAVTNEKQVGSEQMYVAGLKDCHTCLPGYYITNSDPEDGLDSCEICPTKYHHCADGEVTPVEDMPDHAYSTDIYSGLKNCHTCLPGFYPTKLNRYGEADSCYVDGIGPPASGGSQGLPTGPGVSAAIVVTVLSALVV